MSDEIPKSKWKRTVVGGKTAANVGGKVIKYLAKRPFLSESEKEKAKESLEKDYAAEIFKGLVMLKGTALKIAQLLSFELDFVPPAIRKELERSYNQVPPLNRALVRKAIRNSFHESPESIFKCFNTEAFAAASLGQVHSAVAKNGKHLAVKIQYPGINKTIKNDMQLVQGFVKPLPQARFALPVLAEIEERLMEEIDYKQEADNTNYFYNHLKLKNVVVPEVESDYCTDTVIATQHIEGLSLDNWVKTNPSETDCNKIAVTLDEIFLTSLYELKCLHADPNPGNFIIQEDLTIGLVDFGCVKRFTDDFVERYRKLTRLMIEGSKEEYFEGLHDMEMVNKKIDNTVKDEIYEVFNRVAQWYGQLYENEYFDFAQNSHFIAEGKKIMHEFYRFKKFFKPNPEFVFLNRTRYGLFRIYERLQAKVKMKNRYEWG